MDSDQLVPRLEFCRAMRISPRTACKWVVKNYGPQPVRLGGRVYYLRDEIDAFLHGLVSAQDRTSKFTARRVVA